MVLAKDHPFQFVQPEHGVSYHDQPSDELKGLALDCFDINALLYQIPSGFQGQTINILNDRIVRHAGNTKPSGSKKLTLVKPAESWSDLVKNHPNFLDKCKSLMIYIDYNGNVMLVAMYLARSIGKHGGT